MTFLRLLQDARTAVENFFTASWGEHTPIEYQEVSITQTMPHLEWVRPSFQLRYRSHRARLPNCNPEDLLGMIVVQVFVEVPKNGNATEARSRANALAEEAFQIFAAPQISGTETILHLSSQSIAQAGPRPGYVQVNVFVPFTLTVSSSGLDANAPIEPF